MNSVHFYEESIYFNKDFLIDIQLIYKVLLVWSVQNNDLVIHTYISKKKRQNEEALQIAEKRRDAKGKGKKGRDKHLNAEFQRRARRDKKAFLSNQCKEIEENNRIGKTRDLFKKIRDAKGTFHENVGTIKDRNDMDLTEAEDIKKKC